MAASTTERQEETPHHLHSQKKQRRGGKERPQILPAFQLFFQDKGLSLGLYLARETTSIVKIFVLEDKGMLNESQRKKEKKKEKLTHDPKKNKHKNKKHPSF